MSNRTRILATRKHPIIAFLAVAALVLHLLLRFLFHSDEQVYQLPLLVALVIGGVPLVFDLLVKLVKRQFGSDLLAGMSIVTSVLLAEYLAGTLVVLMLSGGEALEAYAVRSASSVLEALAHRMPSVAHRKHDAAVTDIPLEEVAVGDTLVVFPHEICPVDGIVVDGHGVMDESYLTGEPYQMSKAPGAAVLSGAINGETVLTIRAGKLAVDSRYAKIMQVMRASEQHRPQLRRLGDQLGALYTPLAVAIAVAAWIAAGDGGQVAFHFRMLGDQLAAVGDLDCPPGDRPPQALTGALADGTGLRRGQARLSRAGKDGAGERVLGIALQAGHQSQNFLFLESGSRKQFGQVGLAVGQRSGLVEDSSAAGVDFFEHCRVLDDDAAPGRQGDRADDGDGNGNQQRTGSRDHQHGQEACGVTAHRPGEQGNCNGHRRVVRTQLIAEPPQPRPVLLRGPHDLHDFRVARVHRQLIGPDG